MPITLNGTTGITTPAVTNEGAYTGDGVVFADSTPSNTLVTTTGGNVGIGTSSPAQKLDVATTTGNIAISVRSTFSNASASVYYGASRGWFVGADVGGADGRFSWYDNTAGVERMRLTSSSDLQFNSGYGSVATAYGCRAWVNFNASSGTPSIRSSGNISSITDNGVGDFTLNFTTAMPDANYNVVSSSSYQLSNPVGSITNAANSVPTASAFRFRTMNTAWNANLDHEYNSLSVFR